MTGLDTNILVRYFAQDDESQFRAVLRLLTRRGSLYFVSDLVLVESAWVLTSVYDWTDLEIVEAYELLLTISNLTFENEGRVRAALRAVKRGAGLADELIVAASRDVFGCRDLATFDARFAKRHPSFAFVPKAD
ncbi:MAG TPA: type II toxin-antitoxin system VapC family toxin [Prosthecobacter sp.]